MAGALAQPSRPLDSERVRRRRDRHARLAADRALTELAFELRAREHRDRVTDRAPRRHVAASSR
jgi:hypothetical protein